eukprot:629581_1
MAPFVVPNNRANPSLQPSRNASSLSSFAPYSNTNNTEEAHPTMAPFFVPNNRANPTLQSRSALLSSPYSNTNNAEKAHPPIGVNPLLQPSVPLVPSVNPHLQHISTSDPMSTSTSLIDSSITKDIGYDYVRRHGIIPH